MPECERRDAAQAQAAGPGARPGAGRLDRRAAQPSCWPTKAQALAAQAAKDKSLDGIAKAVEGAGAAQPGAGAQHQRHHVLGRAGGQAVRRRARRRGFGAARRCRAITSSPASPASPIRRLNPRDPSFQRRRGALLPAGGAATSPSRWPMRRAPRQGVKVNQKLLASVDRRRPVTCHDRAGFRRLRRRSMPQGRAQLLLRRLVADLETPVSAFLKLGFERRRSATMPSCWKACRAAKPAGAIPSSG